MERGRRDVAGLIVAAVVSIFGGVAAEVAGDVAEPVPDLLGGCGMAIAGVLALANRRARPVGLLLLLAAVTWFAAAAFSEGVVGDVARDGGYLHRGLLLAALLHWSWRRHVRGTVTRWRLAVALTVGIAACLATLDRDLARSPWWSSTTAALAIGVVAVDTVGRRRNPTSVIVAIGGTIVWAAAAGPLRSHQIGSASTRFWLYCAGIATVALCIGGAAAALRRGIASSDLVRDGGSDDLRIAFRLDGDSSFEDVNGVPFETFEGDSMVIVPFDGGLGEVLVTSNRLSIDDQFVDDRLRDGLHLLASHHRALLELRSRAAEVAESEQRIRAADDLASAAIGDELDRNVATNIIDGIALLAAIPSDPEAHECRDDLGVVLEEVSNLAAGLGPRALADGLPAALAALADRHPVPVGLTVDVDELERSTSLALYYAAAEALTNAVRHARCTHIEVSVATTEGGVVLRVADDGIGGVTERPNGGLAGLRRRIEAVPGTFDVRAGREGGTVFTVRLPDRSLADAAASRD